MGLGLLAFSLYFCNQTRIEERGRVGAVIVSPSLLLTFVLLLFLKVLYGPFIVLIFLSLIIFVTIFIKQTGDKTIDEKIPLQKRDFSLYLSSWFIICLNNAVFLKITFRALNLRFSELFNFAQMLRYLAAGFGALIGGSLSDRIGRKLVLELNIMALGIGSTMVGLTMVDSAYVLVQLINGFSWGNFLVIYYLILWGELGFKNTRGIYYSLGLSVFPFLIAVGYTILPLLDKMKLEAAIFISSSLIFVANVPLVFTKETLPLRYKLTIDDIDEYIERVKRELKKITGSV